MARIVKAKRRSGFFRSLIFSLLLFWGVSLGVNYWVYCEIQHRLGIRVTGQYVPSPILPEFELKNGGFVWKDRVQLVRGDIRLTFDPISLFSNKGLRIIVSSTGCKIVFLGDWALQEGVKDATVDTLNADILLGRRGLSGINNVDVKSQSFQFFLKNADKNIEK